jgi:hypothetical protein
LRCVQIHAHLLSRVWFEGLDHISDLGKTIACPRSRTRTVRSSVCPNQTVMKLTTRSCEPMYVGCRSAPRRSSVVSHFLIPTLNSTVLRSSECIQIIRLDHPSTLYTFQDVIISFSFRFSIIHLSHIPYCPQYSFMPFPPQYPEAAHYPLP